MRVAIAPYGSRGDAQPLITLGYELARRGHYVRLVGARNYAAWARQAGLDHTAFDLDAEEVMRSDEAKHVMASGNRRALMRWLSRLDAQFERPYRDALLAGLEDIDAVIAHQSAVERVAVVAAQRRLPVLPVNSMPLCPTRQFRHPLVPLPSLGLPALRQASGELFLRIWWRSARASVQTFRRELGLAHSGSFYQRVLREQGPMLTLMCLALLPRPHDWHEAHVTPGQIVMPRSLRAAFGEATPPEGLDRWLDAGPPPVFFGFGSLPVLDRSSLLAAVEDLTRRLDVRAVIGAGWSDLAGVEADERLIVVGSVDHDWLFPRCIAAVHHGGIGTTNASLSAQLPTMICSVWLDQPFWGERLKHLGVGDTVAFTKLSPARLERGVRLLLRDDVRERARALGAKVAAENGTAAATDAIERMLPRAIVPD